ncbi:hypothetical protein GCM10009675_29260 [Prauserella alba]|uniref:Uncharacterized protein n=1 Tax=Prauserella alba TaxID=176898 RepID=A0ABN1VEE4_9PSEU
MLDGSALRRVQVIQQIGVLALVRGKIEEGAHCDFTLPRTPDTAGMCHTHAVVDATCRFFYGIRTPAPVIAC